LKNAKFGKPHKQKFQSVNSFFPATFSSFISLAICRNQPTPPSRLATSVTTTKNTERIFSQSAAFFRFFRASCRRFVRSSRSSLFSRLLSWLSCRTIQPLSVCALMLRFSLFLANFCFSTSFCLRQAYSNTGFYNGTFVEVDNGPTDGALTSLEFQMNTEVLLFFSPCFPPPIFFSASHKSVFLRHLTMGRPVLQLGSFVMIFLHFLQIQMFTNPLSLENSTWVTRVDNAPTGATLSTGPLYACDTDCYFLVANGLTSSYQLDPSSGNYYSHDNTYRITNDSTSWLVESNDQDALLYLTAPMGEKDSPPFGFDVFVNTDPEYTYTGTGISGSPLMLVAPGACPSSRPYGDALGVPECIFVETNLTYAGQPVVFFFCCILVIVFFLKVGGVYTHFLGNPAQPQWRQSSNNFTLFRAPGGRLVLDELISGTNERLGINEHRQTLNPAQSTWSWLPSTGRPDEAFLVYLCDDPLFATSTSFVFMHSHSNHNSSHSNHNNSHSNDTAIDNLNKHAAYVHIFSCPLDCLASRAFTHSNISTSNVISNNHIPTSKSTNHTNSRQAPNPLGGYPGYFFPFCHARLSPKNLVSRSRCGDQQFCACFSQFFQPFFKFFVASKRADTHARL
jgi:hypothetical protein